MTTRSSRRVPVAAPNPAPHHAHTHAHSGHGGQGGTPSTDAHAQHHSQAQQQQHHPQAHLHQQHHHSVGPPASYQYPPQLHGMDNGMPKREESEQLGHSRHMRASSDPISRGGAFDPDGGHQLDQEPNPFEQSFSGPEPPGPIISRSGYGSQTPSFAGHVSRRARSISPNSLANRQTPGGLNKIAHFPMIPTPGNDLSQFGWPQQSFTPGMMGGAPFDPSMMRTGLTPLGGETSSGGGVSFPPPSPATAALFAMMTNNTPGTAEAAAAAGLVGGGPRPHEGPNEANNFEASFARAASGKHEGGSVQAPDFSSHHRQSQMGPNGRVGHGVMHPSHLQNQVHPPQAAFYPQQTPYGQPQSNFNNSYSQRAHHPGPGPLHLGSAGFPPNNGVEALYNLGQTDSHNDDALVAAAALSGLATPGFHGHTTPLERIAQEKAAALKQAGGTTVGIVAPTSVGAPTSTTSVSNPTQTESPAPSANGGSQPGNGAAAPAKSKRGAAGGGAAANKRKKAEAEETKPKVAPAKKSKRASAAKAVSLDGMDDDMDDDMDQLEGEGQSNPSPAPSNPNETEEEKRKNFLERNRQAALKCRQRKKTWLANLQYKVESLTTDNDTLQATVTNLKEEIQSLRAILQAHANCPVASGADRRGSSVQNLAPNGQQRY
ncbi:hypothetical protein MVLG_01037 [Microbotryum lychnidis-dioicae p1A1 Lamole]|uniref:BZIP domain-containing protein n=1 Tax=Microbotryum lychnidis-dioicae (strain p1A1 Lamole / MvSl-1064) TaxID=683840 RepID=U5H0X0_USTV1|nr:hypothetical protein MVLG_01037 [Microbotryum lychnidis-dioicae p1A1 Lamole]|eukprot:KDE08947.1 hypothetical protein MVLG_01037 [Microbotryum lychnidis-dioicae p1A1 Lamole]